MAANTVRCHVCKDDVTLVDNAAGKVTNIVCPHFQRQSHCCLLKVPESMSIGAFLEMVANSIIDKTFDARSIYCEFADPNDNPIQNLVNALAEDIKRK
jgi:hypothetical protein